MNHSQAVETATLPAAVEVVGSAAMSTSTDATAIAPYGTWTSPISAAMLTRTTRRLAFPALVGEEIWWGEDRPAEQGRTTVMARRPDGKVEELLPAPWNARSRVHEYGGRAWLALPGPDGSTRPALVFVHLHDQRLYRLDPGSTEPIPLTPEPEVSAGLRYAEPIPGPEIGPGTGAGTGSVREIWCIRESHQAAHRAADHPGSPERDLVAVPLDGSAAGDPTGVRSVVAGSTFLSGPRVSPDQTRLAWLAWDHPNMPWDGTRLRVGAIAPDGAVPEWSDVLGADDESVFGPEWLDDRTLVAASDRTGWWNLYRIGLAGRGLAGTEPEPLCPREEEFGQPQWAVGTRTFAVVDEHRILAIHGTDHQRVGLLDPDAGTLTDLDLAPTTYTGIIARDERAVMVAGSPDRAPEVVALDLTDDPSPAIETVRVGQDPELLPDPAWLPVPEPMILPGPGGRDVHANRYPPTNPRYAGPEGEKPPYIVFVHGGPTAHSAAVLDLTKAYFTSRGLGVLDVNYGGSAGYGRAYRDRLQGQWGIVDVEDCAAAARALVDRGEADPARLAIRGGSAGGWTTLAALTRTDVFAAGMSLCGVTDARLLAATTHDFESRYLDGLLGALPAAGAVWDERSPLTHADSAAGAVLLLQGADDPIVPQEQAARFRDALAGHGIRHAMLVFPGEQHGFRKAESVRAAFEAELSFYGQVMGFHPPGIPQVELSG